MFPKNLISTQDWKKEDLEKILELAEKIKRDRTSEEYISALKNKVMFTLFFEKSSRTRASFEAGVAQLGGKVCELPTEKMWIGKHEAVSEIAKVLGSYADFIGIRHCTYGVGNKVIKQFAEHSGKPVINMQCDIYHPCQALADLFTIKEKFGNLKDKKIVVSWAYAERYTKPLSVPQSLLLLLSRFGLDITLAHPPGLELEDFIIEEAKRNSKENNGNFEIKNNMEEAVENSDIVYAKGWGCFKNFPNEDAGLEHVRKFKNWICNQKIMDISPKAFYMHCLPADRGTEVTDEVIDGPRSLIYPEAENRMHVQKALLYLLNKI